MTEKWLKELYFLQRPSEEYELWVTKSFPEHNANTPALSYARVFERRHPSPVERQREIEMICSRGEPAYGYATLAQLVSHEKYGRYCNTILTTNFDDLVADAMYLYGEKHLRPLVITHEALARYVRTGSPRPIVVKLHGDAHLDPKNLQPETRKIDDDICAQVYPFLQNQALIFIGYGGNDESILKFVQDCPIPALSPPIYWVSRQDPPEAFLKWLQRREALRVDHTDSDQLMHLVRGALEIELLDQSRWTKIGDAYYAAFERLKEKIEGASADPGSEALEKATASAQETLPPEWALYLEAKTFQDSNLQRANELYKQALAIAPNNATINTGYAIFLADHLKDMPAAARFFKKATELGAR